jgi:choline dehydrogenase-like flavoprotein
MADFDVCVIGSGAGAGPIILEMAQAGRSVVVLEKGPWLKTPDFAKDEIKHCRRTTFTPQLRDEPHVVELEERGKWRAWPTYNTGWDFWNGSMVGGATTLMAGYFHRLKPVDFRLRSTFGPVEGADVQDWPISYDDLEPYYAKAETEIGISGRVVDHAFAEPRSTPDFPMPPIAEHPISGWLDDAITTLGWKPVPVARAVLSRPRVHADQPIRRPCEQAGYCAMYGCTSGAKGDSRVALLNRAVATGHCTIRPQSMVVHLHSDATGKVIAAEYIDASGHSQRVTAKTFVVACQPIESSRLLLRSTGPKHPNGLANRSGLVGQYLLWSAGGIGRAEIVRGDLSAERAAQLTSPLPFLNRAIYDAYVLREPGKAPYKGGVVDFVLPSPNPIRRAMRHAWDEHGPVWGWRFKDALQRGFHDERQLTFEVFCDWMPTRDSHIVLDARKRDRWGGPVARVRIGEHPQNSIAGDAVGAYGTQVLRALGGRDVRLGSAAFPSTNLTAGGCRFGHNPETSVLDVHCRAHDVPNLYVTDGSFMPTGGSVPYTWTIYANAFRVADAMLRAGV